MTTGMIPSKDYGQFKDDQGRLRTYSLFLINGKHKPTALYTLRDEDDVVAGKRYLSLKQLYLDMEDLTEYEFAKSYFYSWEHWQLVSRIAPVAEAFKGWRQELELRIMAKALRKIKDTAAGDSRDSLPAAKFLLTGGWKHSKGRPSKEQIERAAVELATEHVDLAEDAQRLGLN